MEKGACIERGIVLTACDGLYTVKSCEREGIETPPIEAIGDNEYQANDIVCFFLFRDGTGKIICRA